MGSDRSDRDKLSRRRLLRLAAALPLSALLAACGRPGTGGEEEPELELTLTPEPPFVVAAGEEQGVLMAGTPYEAPLTIFGSGLPGPVLMVLGGAHGNEPGGWLAAERVQERLRPAAGALVVLPRANRLAIADFVRTTPELGDLNRLYPGQADGPPMAQMARQIFETLGEFRVSVLLDLHESWAFYKDRPQNGTAFLGQTVASYPAEPGVSLGRVVVEAVNQRILSPQEELFFRDRSFGGGSSSLGLPRLLNGLAVLLVEMGQQQALERRVALHVDIVEEAARRIGLLGA